MPAVTCRNQLDRESTAAEGELVLACIFIVESVTFRVESLEDCTGGRTFTDGDRAFRVDRESFNGHIACDDGLIETYAPRDNREGSGEGFLSCSSSDLAVVDIDRGIDVDPTCSAGETGHDDDLRLCINLGEIFLRIAFELAKVDPVSGLAAAKLDEFVRNLANYIFHLAFIGLVT